MTGNGELVRRDPMAEIVGEAIDSTWQDQVLTPEQIEKGIAEIARRLYLSIKVSDDAEEAARRASRHYDRAYAEAFLAAGGSQYARKYVAELATLDERDALDVAELAFRHAQREGRRLEQALSALQSINKSMVAMYGASTGTGQ